MIVFNERVISGTVTGASVTWTQELPHNFAYAAHIKWTCTSCVGLVKLQASLDGTNFIDMSDTQEAIANTGEVMWNITDANYRFLKIVCTSTSGAITFWAQLEIKKPSGIH